MAVGAPAVPVVAALCSNPEVLSGDPVRSPSTATSSARRSDSLPELPTADVPASRGSEDWSDEASEEPSEEERSSADGSAPAATASANRSLVVPMPVAWARLVAKSSPDPLAASTADEDAEPSCGTPDDCCSSAIVCSMSANETGLMVIVCDPPGAFRPVVRSSSSTASLRSSSARHSVK